MNRFLSAIPLVLALAVPAVAAPGQEPRQDAPRQESQAPKADYWLSRDMQRLVFWQAREHAVPTRDATGRQGS